MVHTVADSAADHVEPMVDEINFIDSYSSKAMTKFPSASEARYGTLGLTVRR